MAQAPRRQSEQGDRHYPAPGEPGSQRISPPPPDLHDYDPPPPRPGVIPNMYHQQSIFENQPGQQIPGKPAHEGYEPDRQHLRGRIIAEGSAEEDQDPIPEGVPTAEVTLVPSHPNVEDDEDNGNRNGAVGESPPVGTRGQVASQPSAQGRQPTPSTTGSGSTRRS